MLLSLCGLKANENLTFKYAIICFEKFKNQHTFFGQKSLNFFLKVVPFTYGKPDCGFKGIISQLGFKVQTAIVQIAF